ncbi:hypothetical protein J8I87_39540 [Paraburkholderia sp. LEh10]|uniref:hypothetical protein n=1 Tax=Paraburkholderia sp. LEh10 TaxID=2821353 RepID=UPI001AE73848|nr:hypothetical protein [Paraburkholderia sp. LEh10]MBP0595634.1 hypothetical protein [Paraburkholderia sp. LEh10]
MPAQRCLIGKLSGHALIQDPGLLKKSPPPDWDGGPQHAPKVRDHHCNFWNLERYGTTCRLTIRPYKNNNGVIPYQVVASTSNLIRPLKLRS